MSGTLRSSIIQDGYEYNMLCTMATVVGGIICLHNSEVASELGAVPESHMLLDLRSRLIRTIASGVTNRPEGAQSTPW